jgi:hypothetical protein
MLSVWCYYSVSKTLLPGWGGEEDGPRNDMQNGFALTQGEDINCCMPLIFQPQIVFVSKSTVARSMLPLVSKEWVFLSFAAYTVRRGMSCDL